MSDLGGIAPEDRPLRLYLVAGEHSGDALGAKLIQAIRTLTPQPLELAGVGGELMAEAGCPSLFPLSDIAVMSPLAIIARLRFLIRRINETAADALRFQPDMLIILDSPEFTHQVAKRVRKKAPHIPIIDYVSPSVWAWRPGRARKMRPYVDEILAILPFEPDVHKRLGGPPCTYVGHPLVERLPEFDSMDREALRAEYGIAPDAHVLLVLPGSRGSEVQRLMRPFGETLRLVKNEIPELQVILPTVDSVREAVEGATADWPIRPRILTGAQQKFESFRLADVALAASGTVTLELALCRTPMVVAYKVDPLASYIRYLLTVDMVSLPNLILGYRAFPELLQENCTAQNLAAELLPLLKATPALTKQQAALDLVVAKLKKNDDAPSLRAARIVLSYLEGEETAEQDAEAEPGA